MRVIKLETPSTEGVGGWVTEYGVQPFVVEKRRLKGEPTRPATSADHARRLGERLRAHKAGVVVFSRRSNPDLGDYDEPVVLETHGQVPDRAP